MEAEKEFKQLHISESTYLYCFESCIFCTLLTFDTEHLIRAGLSLYVIFATKSCPGASYCAGGLSKNKLRCHLRKSLSHCVYVIYHQI